MKLPTVRLADASRPPVLDFVLPGLLAGTIGIVVGQGGIGKSYLALQVALAVAAGRPVAGGLFPAPARGNVGIIFGEDPIDVLRDRLFRLREAESIDDATAITLDKSLEIVSGVGADLRVASTSPFLGALMALAAGKRLVIVDPLAFLLNGDENDNGAATRLIQLLQKVCVQTGAAILLLHHVSKGGAGEREEWTAARGASAISTGCRWQLHLSPPTRAECADLKLTADAAQNWVRVVATKTSYGRAEPRSWLQRQESGVLVAGTPLQRRYGSQMLKRLTEGDGGDHDF